MVNYVKALLPRLQQFSKSLDHIENFVDKPWIFIDEECRRHTYIFQRDNTLLMSLNGQVQMGKWEYIAPVSSLLIDRGKDKILLNHGFIDKGIMVLRIDGSYDSSWMLINQAEVPDLDAEKYLKQSLIRNLNLKVINLEGRRYYYTDPNNIGIYHLTEFYDEDFKRATLNFSLNGNQNYEVQDGALRKYFTTLRFKTDMGIVYTISKINTLTIGDSVTLQGHQAPDGFYQFADRNMFKGFTVKSGRVVALKEKSDSTLQIFVGIMIFIIVGSAIVLHKKYNDLGSTENTNTGTVPLAYDSSSLYTTEPSASPISSSAPSYNTLTHFSMGSTTDQVLEVQGQPTSREYLDYGVIYYYGKSTVTFINGTVNGYYNSGNLKISDESNAPSY